MRSPGLIDGGGAQVSTACLNAKRVELAELLPHEAQAAARHSACVSTISGASRPALMTAVETANASSGSAGYGVSTL